MKIVTNGKAREVIRGFELDRDEMADFDYLDWSTENGSGPNGEFFRYKGQLYDLGEFMCLLEPNDGPFAGWHAYAGDSFFSGKVVKFVDGNERVVVGRYYQ